MMVVRGRGGAWHVACRSGSGSDLAGSGILLAGSDSRIGEDSGSL